MVPEFLIYFKTTFVNDKSTPGLRIFLLKLLTCLNSILVLLLIEDSLNY